MTLKSTHILGAALLCAMVLLFLRLRANEWVDINKEKYNGTSPNSFTAQLSVRREWVLMRKYYMSPNTENIVHLSQGSGDPPLWLVELSKISNYWVIWGCVHPNGKTNTSSNDRLLVVNATGTTWTSGRNLLYRRALELNRNFLYFIFYDDDVGALSVRTLTQQQLRPSYRSGSRLPPAATMSLEESGKQYFERLLQTEQPAVATVSPLDSYLKHSSRQYANDVCDDKWGFDQCSADQDAMVSAIHKDSATLMLPYSEKFDSTSWWMSQAVFMEMLHMFLPSASVVYAQVVAVNPVHSSYPRESVDLADVVREAFRLGQLRLGDTCATALRIRNNPDWSNYGDRRATWWGEKNGCSDGRCCSCKLSKLYTAKDLCGEISGGV